MAIVRAIASGNWSNTAIWSTGALPTSADDVYSNTFTVTIDTSPTVLSISNASTTGVSAGGNFQIINSGITLTASVNGGNLTNVPSTLIVSIASGQTATVIGSVRAGTNDSCHGISLTGNGTLEVTGNISVSASNTISDGIVIASAGTLNVTGSVTGSNVNPGGNGIAFTASGTLNLVGNATAGSSGAAVAGPSGGVINHTGLCTPSNGASAINNSGTIVVTGPFLVAANGRHALAQTGWFWANSQPVSYYQVRTASLGVVRTLFTADSVAGVPAASNVRSGTVYGPSNELTGTCAVPAAGSVALGVPVDNTSGTAVLTAANVQTALTSQGLTSTRAGYLDNLDTTVSSRLAPSDTLARVTLVDTATTLTNAPTVPTAAQIASQVRVELTPELARMSNASTTQEVGNIVEGLSG